MCASLLVLDEDLCGRNVVLLQSTVLREMLNITTDIITCAFICIIYYFALMDINYCIYCSSDLLHSLVLTN